MVANDVAPGRPRTKDAIQQLVVRMATENRAWDYRRIQGTLANLGHEVGRGNIADILKDHGLEPAPERERKTTWKEFLLRQQDVIVAADFFTIEAWTRHGLTRFLVLFLIDLSTRRVEIAGVTRGANGLDERNLVISAANCVLIEFLDGTGYDPWKMTARPLRAVRSEVHHRKG
jgi:GNAT superfamily N-acetyltransferase